MSAKQSYPDPPPPYSQNYNVTSEYGLPGQPTPGFVAPFPAIISPVSFKIKSKTPTVVICPYCKAHVTTVTQSEPGLITWTAAGIAIAFGCYFGCCLIPFCIDDLQDTRHDCPSCNRTIDVYKTFC